VLELSRPFDGRHPLAEEETGRLQENASLRGLARQMAPAVSRSTESRLVTIFIRSMFCSSSWWMPLAGVFFIVSSTPCSMPIQFR